MAEPSLIDGFRAAFRGHPSGVALVTAAGTDGPVGLTTSSVVSVSVDPVSLAYVISGSGPNAEGLLHAGTCVVHMLGAHDVELAQTFARSGSERFTPEQGWVTLPTGEPYLPSGRVALRCRTRDVVSVGTSRLVVAEVVEVIEGSPGEPVVYQDRAFHTLRRVTPRDPRNTPTDAV
ncbi:flavin reductase [Nigerium massiliense]|uniref:flavin reductase n=1 Tax=Nigerium massiliense TaxID=1522317 RepID=UPI000591694B|nr:flavin reductase [Nigerium massiliense]